MRRTFLLIAIGLLSTAVVADEKPQSFVAPARFVIPEQFQHKSAPEKLELIVDQVAGAAPAACPMDASVIMTEKDSRRTQVYSGTVIHSENGQSTILTCAHMLNRMQSPTFTAEHQKKVYPAKLLRRDDANDLVLFTVDAELPTVDLANEPPAVGQRVTSIGLKKGESELHEMTHVVLRNDDISQRRVLTTGLQYPGRSGGGLFCNGELFGVISGNDTLFDNGFPVRTDAAYMSLIPIREILSRSMAVGAARLTEPVDVDFIKDPGHCPPCNRSERAFVGNENWPDGTTKLIADGQLRVTKRTGVSPDWYTDDFVRKNPHAGYPFYRFKKTDGEWKTLYGATDTERLLEAVANEFESHEVSAVPSGASIQGKETFTAFLSYLQAYAGPDAIIEVSLHREGGKDAFLMKGMPTQTELLGTHGRLEIVIKTAKHVVVDQIKFDYGFDADGVPWIDLDKTRVNIPKADTVGASQPVGNPIMIAWTILSTIQTIHAILNPSVDVWVGPDISATATLSDGKLSIVSGPNPIAVRAHWAFWFGLIKFDYSRALTGVVLSNEGVVAQFHKARLYRDVSIPWK